MPRYPLTDKLQAIKDSLTREEMNLLCQERIDGYAQVVYRTGWEEGRAKLLQEQRDERERRKDRGLSFGEWLKARSRK